MTLPAANDGAPRIGGDEGASRNDMHFVRDMRFARDIAFGSDMHFVHWY